MNKKATVKRERRAGFDVRPIVSHQFQMRVAVEAECCLDSVVRRFRGKPVRAALGRAIDAAIVKLKSSPSSPVQLHSFFFCCSEDCRQQGVLDCGVEIGERCKTCCGLVVRNPRYAE